MVAALRKRLLIALAGALEHLAEVTRRSAGTKESLRPAVSETSAQTAMERVRSVGPPDHWLEKVRRSAPWLLDSPEQTAQTETLDTPSSAPARVSARGRIKAPDDPLRTAESREKMKEAPVSYEKTAQPMQSGQEEVSTTRSAGVRRERPSQQAKLRSPLPERNSSTDTHRLRFHPVTRPPLTSPKIETAPVTRPAQVQRPSVQAGTAAPRWARSAEERVEARIEDKMDAGEAAVFTDWQSFELPKPALQRLESVRLPDGDSIRPLGTEVTRSWPDLPPDPAPSAPHHRDARRARQEESPWPALPENDMDDVDMDMVREMVHLRTLDLEQQGR